MPDNSDQVHGISEAEDNDSGTVTNDDNDEEEEDGRNDGKWKPRYADYTLWKWIWCGRWYIPLQRLYCLPSIVLIIDQENANSR